MEHDGVRLVREAERESMQAEAALFERYEPSYNPGGIVVGID
jgi:hypothetical protein